MDNNEATSTVMSRIQRLDPENACKIMGYILIQDPGEKEMIRLAFGPENHLISLINQAKSFLGISSNISSAPSTPSPSPFNPMSNPHNRSNPFPISAPRIVVPNNGFHSSPSSPWFSNTSHLSPRPSSSSSLSYAAVINGNNSNNINGNSPSNSSFSQFYSNPSCENEDYSNIPVDDELLFLEDGKDLNFMDPIMSPSGRSDSILFPFADNGENRHHLLHKRSLSVSDAFLGGQLEDGHGGGGGGWRPCMYYAKGFCKNGSGCKFVHGGIDSQEGLVGSPGLDGFEEFVRMKALQHQQQQQQQQRLALVGGGGGPHLYNNRCMNNFLNENPRSAAAVLMMGEECHSFGRCRPDRNDFAALGYGGISNSSSRQIYLTFPADSTFKEEDVSNYFNTFGPVQDVRIPYQQKRMFGFVTFVYPETVKQILAKGNPHFVCESRVLVKPYKEKGKILDKKQHMDRGDFPACLSPSGLDSRDPCDLPFGGGRMLYNSQEMLLRRKLEEQAELQQAIDFQGRRLMNFQLSDLSNNHPNHPFQPHLLAAGPRNSPTAHTQISQNLMFASEAFNQDDFEGTNTGKREVISPNDAGDPNAPLEMNKSCNYSNGDNNITNDEGNIPNSEDSFLHASLEHVLPDNLFASPTKSAADNQALLCVGSAESDNCSPTTVESSSNTISVLATTSMLSVTSLKS